MAPPHRLSKLGWGPKEGVTIIMILKQYYLGCLAHASYLLGDEASANAIIVDPQRDIQQYLADAEKFGLQIRHVFLTHFHADFLAGHLELRDRCGATIHLGSRAQAEYSLVAMKDGDTLDFPGLRLQVLETPGHTIESISILVFDLQKDPARAHAVLTGDTLFIGDVGRPDLRASLGWTADDLGAHLYDSLHNKLLPLHDEILVYPAHGAGSLCGKQLSSDTVSSLGDQRRLNYALQPYRKKNSFGSSQPTSPTPHRTSPTMPSSTPASMPRWIGLLKMCCIPSISTRSFGWEMRAHKSSTSVTLLSTPRVTSPAAST